MSKHQNFVPALDAIDKDSEAHDASLRAILPPLPTPAAPQVTEVIVEKRVEVEVERIVDHYIEVAPEGSIVPQEDGTWIADHVQLTATGLAVNGDPTPAQWLNVGKLIQRVESSYQWLVGDWVVGCQVLFGDTYQTVVEETGYEYSTVKQLAYIARNVPLSVRTDKLKFAVYAPIAALRLEDGSPDQGEQHYWIERAVDAGWSASQLRAAIKGNPPTLTKRTISDKKIDSVRVDLLSWYKEAKVETKRKMISTLESVLDIMKRDLR